MAVGQATRFRMENPTGLDGAVVAFTADGTATNTNAAASATHAPRDRRALTVAAPTTMNTRMTKPIGYASTTAEPKRRLSLPMRQLCEHESGAHRADTQGGDATVE